MKSPLTRWIIAGAAVAGLAGLQPARTAEPAPLEYQIKLDTIRKGFDSKRCWVHPRAGTIPGDPPTVVLTMQQLLLSGSDVFYALNEVRTDNLGASWSEPTEHAATLGRPHEGGGEIVAP